MHTEKCNQALGYWTVGRQYIHLVENIIEETINQGNLHVISSPSLTWEKYDQDTKWSDHKIIIPTLFNLYHGFEVILKGFWLQRGIQ